MPTLPALTASPTNTKPSQLLPSPDLQSQSLLINLLVRNLSTSTVSEQPTSTSNKPKHNRKVVRRFIVDIEVNYDDDDDDGPSATTTAEMEEKSESKYEHKDEGHSPQSNSNSSTTFLTKTVKTLTSSLTSNKQKLASLTTKLTTIMSSLEIYRTSQTKLFQKYNDLKLDLTEMEKCVQRFIWYDMFGIVYDDVASDTNGSIEYNFSSLQKLDPGLHESQNKIGNDIVVGKMLGEGQFATVYSCYNVKDMNKTMAVKSIKKSKIKTFDALKRLDNELYILNLLKGLHPSVLQITNVLHGVGSVYVFTEKLDLDLFDFYDDHPNGVSEALSRIIVLGILQGVQFLHSQNIVHRDLKPENILLRRIHVNNQIECEYDVVICDFGLCAQITYSPSNEPLPLRDFSGSPGFFAPEMFIHGVYNGFMSDVWSVGCILLELLVGHETFGECWMTGYDEGYMSSRQGFGEEIQSAVKELKELRLPKNLSNFLQLLLSDVNGRNRPSASVLLKDVWFTEAFPETPEKGKENENGGTIEFLAGTPKKKDQMNPRKLNSLHSPSLKNFDIGM